MKKALQQGGYDQLDIAILEELQENGNITSVYADDLAAMQLSLEKVKEALNIIDN